MIPYVPPPSLDLGPVEIPAFTLLALAAVVVGYEIVVRRAPRIGFSREEAAGLVGWTILVGLVVSHAVDTLVYFPERVRRDPLELLRVWNGMSSFGGMAGGLATASFLMWRRGYSGARMLAFVDGVAFAFPFSWIFGRLGCALAHDHMGIASSHPLAVRFPDGPAFDLGLLELLVTLPIALLFRVLDRRPRPVPLYLGLFFALYGPARFLLDTLRTGDVRYLGWTPGQYGSLVVTILGAGLLGRLAYHRSRSDHTPEAKRAAAATSRPR